MKEPNVCRFFGSLSVAYAAPVWTSDEIKNLLLKSKACFKATAKSVPREDRLRKAECSPKTGCIQTLPAAVLDSPKLFPILLRLSSTNCDDICQRCSSLCHTETEIHLATVSTYTEKTALECVTSSANASRGLENSHCRWREIDPAVRLLWSRIQMRTVLRASSMKK